MYELIKGLCAKRGISINELENALKFSRGSICKWDDSRPSVDRVAAVSNYFDVSIDYFLEDLQDQNKKGEKEN